MRKIFNIETSSEAEWDSVFKIIKESFDDKYFMEFEISVPYKIYNSNAFHEWLEKLMFECRVNNSCSGYRFWRFDEHIMECDASYRKIIFRKEYTTNLKTLKSEHENLSKHCENLENELTNAKHELSICQRERNSYARQVEEVENVNKLLDANNSNLQSHCENQKKEINLLLKQKAKLEKELEACKNHQIDMLAYRDDIIGKITREKNELKNANMAQTRYIKEMEENMKKGNEEYKKLKDAYDEKYRKLEEKYDKNKRLLNSVYGANKMDLKKANEFYHSKIHEMFDMLLTAEFLQKEDEKE